MTTTPSARSTRATTNFKYSSKREIGQPKTLVTVRLENTLLDKLAKIGNAEKLSMSATVRRVIRKGLDLPEEPAPAPVSKSTPRPVPGKATPRATPAKGATGTSITEARKKAVAKHPAKARKG